MKCSILRNEFNKEVDSNLYQKLLQDNSKEEALSKLYQSMVYAAVNNGKYAADSMVEAIRIKNELSTVFGKNVSISTGLNTFEVFIKKPSFLSESDLEELNNMDVVSRSTIYKQSEAQLSKDKIIEVQSNDEKGQTKITEKLQDTRSKLDFDEEGNVKLTEGEEDPATGKSFLHYTLKTGEVIQKRVSSLTQALFTRNKTKEALQEIEKKSEPNKQIGSSAHNILEKTIGYLASQSEKTQAISTNGQVDSFKEEGYDPSFTHADNLKLQEGAKKLFNYITKTQDKINELTNNPDGKARLFLENLIYDPKKDMGGSIDLMVVYSDGSVSVYDYKFIQMKTTRENGKKVIADQWIGKGKEGAFNLQIGEYKRILSEYYGVENFRESRIIPAHIEVQKDAQTKDLKQMLTSVSILDPSVPQLLPIPVAGEQAQNKFAQDLIKDIRSRIKDLQSDIKELRKQEDESGAIEMKELAILDLKKSEQAILVNDDFSMVIKDLERMLSDIDFGLEHGLSESKIHRYITYIDTFNTVLPYIKGNLKEQDRPLLTEIGDTLRMRGVILQDELKSRIISDIPIDKPFKEMGFVGQYLTNLSMYKHPIFVKFRELVKGLFQNVQDNTRKLAEEAEEIREVVKSWADKNGKSLIETYQLFIDPETGKLVSKYGSEFFEKQREAREKKDKKWFWDNYDYTGKDIYEKDRKNYMKILGKYYDKDSKVFNSALKNWEIRNNLSKGEAWLTNPIAVSKYATKKDTSKWNDKGFEYIQTQPELLKLYDWLVAKNQDFNERVSEKIDDQFIPNIQKNFVQTIAQDGNIWKAFKDQGTSLHQSIQVRANDSITGAEDNKIPLLYYDTFRFKKGDGQYKKARASRSEDLIYNTVLFGNQVFLNQERNAIEDRAQSLRILLKSTKALKTDWKNDIVLDENRQPIELDYDSKAIDAYDALLGNYVYGRALRSKDRVVEFNGNHYSLTKILLKLMSYMSVKSLSFNYVSGFGNLGGAYINSFIKGMGGQFYTSKQLLEGHKMLVKRSNEDAWNRLSEYFNIEKDFWAKEQADKLSATALTRNLTYDKWYIFQQKGDEFVANSVLMAMLQNYGISEQGTIFKLSELPEGSPSLMDRYKIVDDKVVIDGLTKEGYKDFRNRVKYISRSIKGTNTAEDISVIQTELWGRSVMHFRNWIAPMVKERFGTTTYTQEIKDWEFGRLRLLTKELVKNFRGTSVEVLKSLILFKKVNLSDGNAQEVVEKYNKEHGTELTVDGYLAARQQQMQAAISELRSVSIVLAILLGMGWEDDDGEKLYNKFTLGRSAMRILDRVHNELTFFINPTSVNEIIKSPIPVMRVLEDAINLGNNTLDEFGDTVFGEDETNDRSPVLSKTGRMFPVVPWIVDIITDFQEED